MEGTTTNRLSAEYRERVEREAILRWAQVVARIRDEATEGGRKYGEVKVSPQMAMAMAAVEMEQPPMEGAPI